MRTILGLILAIVVVVLLTQWSKKKSQSSAAGPNELVGKLWDLAYDPNVPEPQQQTSTVDDYQIAEVSDGEILDYLPEMDVPKGS